MAVAAGRRVGRGQAGDGGNLIGRRGVCDQVGADRGVALLIEEGQALAERARGERLAVDLAITDVDVDRDRVVEMAVEILDNGIERSDEPSRQIADRLVEDKVDIHSGWPRAADAVAGISVGQAT